MSHTESKSPQDRSRQTGQEIDPKLSERIEAQFSTNIVATIAKSKPESSETT